MKQLNIAFVGLENRTVQACISMLGIMESMSSIKWQSSDIDDADVLMVCQSKLADLSTTKPFIAVYRTGEAKPDAKHTLSQPFRAMPLMTVLEDIHQSHFADDETPDTAAMPVTSQPDNPVTRQDTNQQASFDLFKILANIMHSDQLLPGILPLKTSAGIYYIEPRTRTFFCDSAALQSLSTDAVACEQLKTRISAPPGNLLQRPLFWLIWHLTSQYQQLAPWISPDKAYRLIRWPYFGNLPKNQERLTLCAILSRSPLPYNRLTKLVNIDRLSLHHFLNAASISGLLKAEQAAPVRVTEKPVNNRLGSLIRGLRSRFGLGT